MRTIKLQRIRGLLAAAGLGGLFIACSGPASATTTVVNNVGLADTYTVTISDSSFPTGEDVYLTPLVLNGSSYVFCVDPYHEISLGSQNYTFNSAALTTNSDGQPGNGGTGTGTNLTTAQIGEIGALVELGDHDLNQNNFIGASGVQGAIWEILGATVTANGGSPTGLATDISNDLTWAQLAGNARLTSAIYDKTDDVQGFARPYILDTPVPEPSVWLMLIAGFGLIGGVMRGRRSAALPTATSIA